MMGTISYVTIASSVDFMALIRVFLPILVLSLIENHSSTRTYSEDRIIFLEF